MHDALSLQEAGCFSLVLECIPQVLAEKISRQLLIPTIGIGAGSNCDGQILVLQDMLGMNKGFNPKFLKKYMDGHSLIANALNEFASEVSTVKFPTTENSYD